MARAIGDLVLAALVVAGAVTLFIGAADLPPPRFEPLGSAALPRILGSILILLAVAVAIRAVLRWRAATPARSSGADAPERSPVVGALVFVALVAYVAALDFARAPFVPATAAFLGAVGLILSRGSWRAGAVYAVLGLALGVVLAFVFSRFLYISIG